MFQNQSRFWIYQMIPIWLGLKKSLKPIIMFDFLNLPIHYII